MFRVTLKESYKEFNFDFDEWNDACNFAGDALLHGADEEVEVKLSQRVMIKIGTEETDGNV